MVYKFNGPEFVRGCCTYISDRVRDDGVPVWNGDRRFALGDELDADTFSKLGPEAQRQVLGLVERGEVNAVEDSPPKRAFKSPEVTP